MKFNLVLILAIASGCASSPTSRIRPGEIIFSAMGDILLWTNGMLPLAEELRGKGQDPAGYPFAKVKHELQGIVFGNLEGPVTGLPPIRFKPAWMKHYFAMPPELTIPTLKAAGIDIVSLANNHAKDSGRAGLLETLGHLDVAKIAHVGAGRNLTRARRPVTVSRQGSKLVFLAYNMIGPKGTNATATGSGAATGDEEELVRDLRRAGEPGTSVVVSLHWGEERKIDLPLDRPRAWQRQLARRLIDEGAALVLGAHTHAVTEFEEYRHGLIVYSMGNFVFSGNGGGGRRYSVILRAALEGPAVSWYTLIPVRIDPPTTRYQPYILERSEGEAFLQKVLFNPASRHLSYYGGSKKAPLKSLALGAK